jgi:hypothetical protein
MKVIKLNESDIKRIVKRVLSEGTRGAKSQTNDALIPLIYGLTYDVKLFQNGKDITDNIESPNTTNYTDIKIYFPKSSDTVALDADKFEVKFTPIDGDKLDGKKQRELKKIYKEQGFKMGRGESFPILSPTTLPSFRIGYDSYDKIYEIFDGKKSYAYGNEYPYDKKHEDYELYNGDQFNVYVKFKEGNADIITREEWQNKKTVEKLNKSGWSESSVNIDEIIGDEELEYVEKAGKNSRGFAGVFIGNSENDIKYFIYIPGLQGYRGMSNQAYKDDFFRQFKKDVEGVYEGGEYFEYQ